MVKITQLAFKSNPGRANIVLMHCFTMINIKMSQVFLFNDSYVTLLCLLATLVFQMDQHFIGVLLISLGIGVKMSAVLFLPAVYLITSKARGVVVGTLYMILIAALQVAFAYPFIKEYPKEYFERTFDFSRSFNVDVSYNWNLMPQHVVDSALFKNGLLALHLLTLLFFLFTRWLRFSTMFKVLGLYPLRF